MCGIVSYIGRPGGSEKVINALELLAYRAPDSTGVGMLAADGRLAVRRAVGTADKLRQLIEEDPLPPLSQDACQVVVGHGRWAMVGEVTVTNAHPISDRSGSRLVCENGSHNPVLMLDKMGEQKTWWWDHGATTSEPVHRSQNTTEVIALEWEQLVIELSSGKVRPEEVAFVHSLKHWQITDVEEQAVRLAMARLTEGNAHACALYSRKRPNTLYVSSHNKPAAIVSRSGDSQAMMVVSDVNAALMLWPKEQVQQAAARLEALAAQHADAAELEAVANQFQVDVVFLDNDLHSGLELFARIEWSSEAAGPLLQLSRYDGTPVSAAAQQMVLNPAMVGKRGFPSFTESHIDEIPDVLDTLVAAYVRNEEIHLDGAGLRAPGLNVGRLKARFGPHLERLRRLVLIGEGSSWRDGLAVVPLLKQVMPDLALSLSRPVEVLNLGQTFDADHDLVVEISWSGTTDSLLKADGMLRDLDVMRAAVTGRPQSDLGRRAAGSGGTINVHTGVEVSVATVKGYEGILFTLCMLAMQLGELRDSGDAGVRQDLAQELVTVVPVVVRQILCDGERRKRIKKMASQFSGCNKVVVVGNSPAVVEAELKIEELAQVVACHLDYGDVSLRALVERSAAAQRDQERVLVIINATDERSCRQASSLVSYLRGVGQSFIIHTIPNENLELWRDCQQAAVFVSAAVSPGLQPLVDALFFFELSVALAYGRGLTAEAIDRPRNLAKSVTTTGAERRQDVESRQDFTTISLSQFIQRPLLAAAKSASRPALWRQAENLKRALGQVMAAAEALRDDADLEEKGWRDLGIDRDAVVNGARMAAVMWPGRGVSTALPQTSSRSPVSFGSEHTSLPGDLVSMLQPALYAASCQVQSGMLQAEANGIRQPAALTPLESELWAAAYVTRLALQEISNNGEDTASRESALAKMPATAANILVNNTLSDLAAAVLTPLVGMGYDKVQIIGGGRDHVSALSTARSLRQAGFMAEALYTDSAWHGPLATVGGPGADQDTLIVCLAMDPLFQTAALVDAQVYRTRKAKVLLVVPEGNEELASVQGVGAVAVFPLTQVPAEFLPWVGAAFGSLFAWHFGALWEARNAQRE